MHLTPDRFDTILAHAVCIAHRNRREPIPIRIGKDWTRGPGGKKAEIAPLELFLSKHPTQKQLENYGKWLLLQSQKEVRFMLGMNRRHGEKPTASNPDAMLAAQSHDFDSGFAPDYVGSAMPGFGGDKTSLEDAAWSEQQIPDEAPWKYGFAALPKPINGAEPTPEQQDDLRAQSGGEASGERVEEEHWRIENYLAGPCLAEILLTASPKERKRIQKLQGEMASGKEFSLLEIKRRLGSVAKNLRQQEWVVAIRSNYLGRRAEENISRLKSKRNPSR